MRKGYAILIVAILIFAFAPIHAQTTPEYKKVLYHIDKLNVDLNYLGENETIKEAFKYLSDLIDKFEGSDIIIITGNMTETKLYFAAFLKVDENIEIDLTKLLVLSEEEEAKIEGPTKYTLPALSVIPLSGGFSPFPEDIFTESVVNQFLTLQKLYLRQEEEFETPSFTGYVDVNNTNIMYQFTFWIDPALKDLIKSNWEFFGGTATEEDNQLKLTLKEEGGTIELVYDLENGFLSSIKVSGQGSEEELSGSINFELKRTSIEDAKKNVPTKNSIYAYKATEAAVIEGLGEIEPLFEQALAARLVYNVTSTETGLDFIYDVNVLNETEDKVIDSYQAAEHVLFFGSVVVYPEWDIIGGLYQLGASLMFQALSHTEFEYNETDWWTGENYTYKGYYEASGTYKVLQRDDYGWVAFKTDLTFVYNETIYKDGKYNESVYAYLKGYNWFTYNGNGELMQDGYNFSITIKIDTNGDGVFQDNETITGTLNIKRTRVQVQDGQILWEQIYEVPSIEESGWSEATPAVVYENEQRTKLITITVVGVAVVAVAAVLLLKKLRK